MACASFVAGCEVDKTPIRLKNAPLLCSESPGGRARPPAVIAQTQQAGLDFPGSAATQGTIRFRFTSPLAPYPATYIWKILPRSQASYYTTFFWGNDDGASDVSTFLWDGGKSNTYYGAHPYPYPAPNIVPPEQVGPRHWEISVSSMDVLSASTVDYDRWHSQALLVWADVRGLKHHVFYWDLPDTRKVIRHVEKAQYGELLPPKPTLTFGDAPWSPSKEILFGSLRGIQIYSGKLSVPDVLMELKAPLSTKPGSACIWYLNLNPTPEDISDKSGSGNDPEWVGEERPGLWKEEQK
jgi:hypothetical protein